MYCKKCGSILSMSASDRLCPVCREKSRKLSKGKVAKISDEQGKNENNAEKPPICIVKTLK